MELFFSVLSALVVYRIAAPLLDRTAAYLWGNPHSASGKKDCSATSRSAISAKRG
jgi:hypothetical protein